MRFMSIGYYTNGVSDPKVPRKEICKYCIKRRERSSSKKGQENNLRIYLKNSQLQ